MIIINAEIKVDSLVDVFGYQLEDYQLESFALLLVQEDIGKAARLRNHLEYHIKVA